MSRDDSNRPRNTPRGNGFDGSCLNKYKKLGNTRKVDPQ